MSKTASDSDYGYESSDTKTPSLTVNPLFGDGFTADTPAYCIRLQHHA